MVRFRILGKRIIMSEEWWKQLKQRFNPNNATFSEITDRWIISLPCQWCKYIYSSNGCRSCTWDKFRSMSKFINRYYVYPIPGCIKLIQQFMKKVYGIESDDSHRSIGGILVINQYSINWTRGVDKEARQILYCTQTEFQAIEDRRRK